MADAGPTALRFAGFTLDLGARALMDAGGREVALRRSEYELLRAFLAAPGRALRACLSRINVRRHGLALG